jgi:hypothetical protein
MRPSLLVLAVALSACVDPETGEPLVDDAATFPVDQAPPPPVLSVFGSCPGAMNIVLTDLTPGGNWVLGASPVLAPGVVIPSGPCAGTPLRIGPPAYLIGTGVANAVGVDLYSVTVPPVACGWFIQAVDISTCTQSFFETL